MSESPLGLPADYSLTALLRHWQEDTKASLYCHLPGVVEKFYPTDQTADVSVTIQRLLDGERIQIPVLVKCPVMVLTGGATGVITLPISAGDTCLVCIADRDIDTWWSTGVSAPPVTRRTHDLSDAFAIIGFRHSGNPVSSFSTTHIEVKNNGGRVAVGTKLKVNNATTSLLTILSDLITALKAEVDTGGHTHNGATIAAYDAVQTKVNALLE